MASEKKIKFYLFLFFTSFYLLFSGDHFSEPYYASDERLMILTTQQIVDNFSLHFPETYGVTTSRYGILQPIVAIPFYLLSKVAGLFFLETKREIVSIFCIYFTNAFISAFLIICFYSFSRYLKYPVKTAFYSSLVLGLCSIVFPYSKYFFAEPLVALTLLNSVYNFVKATKLSFASKGHLEYANIKENKRNIYLLKSSIWLSLSILAKIDNLPLLFIFIPAIILVNYGRKQNGKIEKSINGMIGIPACQNKTGGTPALLIFFIPLLICGIILLILNYLRFGSLFAFGYNNEPFTTNLLVGIYGLLLSTGRGLLIYSPPIIISIFLIKRFWQKRSFLTLLIIGITIIKLYFFGKWWSWYGGWSWGSRFLLPLVPLYLLFINEAFLRYKRFSPIIRILIILIVIVGFVVQLLGVMVNPSKYDNNIFGLINKDENLFLFLPQLSSLFGNIDIIKMGFIDSFILKFTTYFSSVLLLSVLFVLICFLFISFTLLKKIVGFRLKDFIAFKPLRLFTRLEKLITILIIINLIIYLISFVAVYSNTIPRYIRIKFYNDEESLKKESDYVLCLESSGKFKKDSAKDEKEIKEINMKWQGTIWIPKDGDYWFHIKASGYYLLNIDNKNILGNKDVDYQHTSTALESFKRGYYDFVLDYKPVDVNYRLMHLYWTVPGNGIYKSLLSNKFLFPEKPTIFKQFLLTLNTFKFFFVILSIIIVYVVQNILGRKNIVGCSSE